MEKINITDDILKHDEEAIIALLYDKMKDIRLAFHGGFTQGDPAIVYSAYNDVELVTDVLRKLNRRNEEKAVQ